jgi:bifunctional DNA-binding transcriptional regulator/antitoxin component of YhaV-PrlF toxin-antitoxin module
METGFTKLSSRGQVVIPQGMREGISAGTPFAVTRKKDLIILRAMEMPSREKELERILAWGHQYAKEKGLRPEDLDGVISDMRR